MMFVIATKTEKWNKALKEIQTVLHYVSGKKFYYRSFYKKYINTTSHCGLSRTHVPIQRNVTAFDGPISLISALD